MIERNIKSSQANNLYSIRVSEGSRSAAISGMLATVDLDAFRVPLLRIAANVD